MRLFDLHCDTLYECDRQNCELWENALDLDVKRGLALDAFVQVFAAFIPDELRGTAAQDHGLRLLDLAAAQAELYSQLLPVKLENSPEIQRKQLTIFRIQLSMFRMRSMI